eukprot:354830-Chlamydomonas_euryale.AAC.5
MAPRSAPHSADTLPPAGEVLDAGRPVCGRCGARGAAPAVRTLLAPRAARPGRGLVARAVPTPGVAGGALGDGGKKGRGKSGAEGAGQALGRRGAQSVRR